MIRVRLGCTLDKIMKFVDDRLLLAMAERNIKNRTSSLLSIGSSKKYLRNVNGTVFIVEESNDKTSFFVDASTQKISDSKDALNYCYGVALRSCGQDMTDLYIETMRRAREMGLIPTAPPSRLTTIIMWIILGLLLVVLAPFVPFILLLFPIIWPFVYFSARSKFRKQQRVMQTLVQIFESEFRTIEKFDTKDRVGILGVVKSGVKINKLK